MPFSARRTPLLLAGTISAVALIAAGCGSSGSSTAGPGPTSGNQITVLETEFHLALPRTTFTPGSYTFTAVDKGQIAHALSISGPGVNATTKTLTPGQSASITVTLAAGSYDLFCPIDSHKSLGMNQEITVSGSAAAANTSAPASSGAAATTGAAAGTGAAAKPSSPATTTKAAGGGYGY